MCENKQIVKCKKCETYHIFDFQTREVVDNVGKIIRMRAVSAASSILPGKHGLICFFVDKHSYFSSSSLTRKFTKLLIFLLLI